MKIRIVCYEDLNAWILGKFARCLREQLAGRGIPCDIAKQPDPSATINHHIAYCNYNGQKVTTETVMVTHIDARWKTELVQLQLQGAEMAICMSSQTMRKLAEAGLPRDKLCYISPPQDGVIKPRKMRVGITSRLYPSGCKREAILAEIAPRIPPADFSFCIMGDGWVEIVRYLQKLGFEVAYHETFDRSTYGQLIPALDYYLYFGQDEGSMGFLDALAAGVKTIVTPQGFHLDVPGGITHSFNTADELVEVFRQIGEARARLPRAVAGMTWETYANHHLLVWKHVLERKAGLPSNRAEWPALARLGIEPPRPEKERVPPAKAITAPPRILLIIDVPNWIFARHCRTFQKHLRNEFQFDVLCKGEDYREDDYDLIYPLEWNLVATDRIRTPCKYITGIRSHVFWSELDFTQICQYLQTHFQRIHVVSKRLYDIFSPSIPRLAYVTHGIDTQHFCASRATDQSGHRVRIGWAGNRNSRKPNGFREIVEPLGQLPDVELVYCGYADRNLTIEAMRDFYDQLDIYICASESEGNSNTIMEAASMERCIITTDNGTVPEYLENGTSAIIVERTLKAFADAVRTMQAQPEVRSRLGNNARRAVLNGWDWKDKIKHYRRFFLQGLASVNAGQPSPADKVKYFSVS